MRAPVTIMTVCTGNVCRSPLAELLLAERLSGLPVALSSAGTRALEGETTPPPITAALRRHGVDRSHVASTLTVPRVVESEFVLGLAREHRRAVIELVPRAARRTMTLLELARVVAHRGTDLVDEARGQGDDDASRLSLALAFALAERGTVPPSPSPDDDDVVDPWGHDAAVYARSISQVEAGVGIVADYLLSAVGRR